VLQLQSQKEKIIILLKCLIEDKKFKVYFGTYETFSLSISIYTRIYPFLV